MAATTIRQTDLSQRSIEERDKIVDWVKSTNWGPLDVKRDEKLVQGIWICTDVDRYAKITPLLDTMAS